MFGVFCIINCYFGCLYETQCIFCIYGTCLKVDFRKMRTKFKKSGNMFLVVFVFQNDGWYGPDMDP